DMGITSVRRLARDPGRARDVVVAEIGRILSAVERDGRIRLADEVIGLRLALDVIGDRRRDAERRGRYPRIEGRAGAREVVADRLDALRECGRVARAVGDRGDVDGATSESRASGIDAVRRVDEGPGGRAVPGWLVGGAAVRAVRRRTGVGH